METLIPRGGISEIYDNIDIELKAKMIKHMFQDEKDPESFLEDHIKTLITTVFYSQKSVDFSEIGVIYKRRRRQHRKNWFNSLVKEVEKDSNSPIHAEANSIQKVLEMHGNRKELTNELYKGDPATFIQRRLMEVEAWVNDSKSHIFQYPYLDSKTPFQLERAFEIDLIYLVSEYLKTNPKIQINRYPAKMLDVSSVFHMWNKSVKGNSNMMVNSDGNTELFDQFKLSNDMLIVSILRPNENDEIMLDKMTWLDTKDRDIVDIALNARGERFIKEKKVSIDLRQLVKEVYNSESNRAYQLVKDRLTKISKFYIEGRVMNKNKETYQEFSFNLFQGVVFHKDMESGRVYAEILFSDFLHQQYIDHQTIQIYSHLIKKLEKPESRILVYAFQKERLDAYLEKRPIRQFYEYDYFYDRIRFRSKKLEQNLKFIQFSLEEFKELNILVENYKRDGNGFDIVLHPITDDEKADFFSSTALKRIEG